MTPWSSSSALTRWGWQVETDAQNDCVAYRIRWENDDGTIGFLPETGAWQYGENCELWIQEAPEGCSPPLDTGTPAPECPEQDFEDKNGDCLPDEDIEEGFSLGKLFGCASTPTPPSAFWCIALSAVLMTRRQRPYSTRTNS